MDVIESMKLVDSLEAAELLGFARMTFWLKRRRGDIVIPKFVISKRKFLFKKNDVLALKESLARGGCRYDDIPDDKERLMTLREVAQALNIRLPVLRSMRSQKRLNIQFKRVNGKLRCKLSDLEKYLQSSRQEV